MSSFTVYTAALDAGARQIEACATTVASARSAAEWASCQAPFGGEPIEGPYGAMCGRAVQAMTEIETTIHQLAVNVAAASVGYLVTDRGVVPIKALEADFKP